MKYFWQLSGQFSSFRSLLDDMINITTYIM